MERRPETLEELLPFGSEEEDSRVIDLTRSLAGEVFLSPGRCYQAEETLCREEDLLIVRVRSAGLILPPAEEVRRRWLLCRYPAGQWKAYRPRALEVIRAHGVEKTRWRRADIGQEQRDGVRRQADAGAYEYRTLLLSR